MLNDGFELAAAELKRAQSLIEKILRAGSFDELYQLLGFEYVVERSGSLSQFPSDSFQLVVSGGVLEHVKKEALPVLIAETRRILNPDGWAVHSIDTADHLEQTETGGIAAECDRHLGLHLFEDLVIPEVVDDEGRPVRPGATSNSTRWPSSRVL
jgi:SAM-dependent methyltransferase